MSRFSCIPATTRSMRASTKAADYRAATNWKAVSALRQHSLHPGWKWSRIIFYPHGLLQVITRPPPKQWFMPRWLLQWCGTVGLDWVQLITWSNMWRVISLFLNPLVCLHINFDGIQSLKFEIIHWGLLHKATLSKFVGSRHRARTFWPQGKKKKIKSLILTRQGTVKNFVPWGKYMTLYNVMHVGPRAAESRLLNTCNASTRCAHDCTGQSASRPQRTTWRWPCTGVPVVHVGHSLTTHLVFGNRERWRQTLSASASWLIVESLWTGTLS